MPIQTKSSQTYQCDRSASVTIDTPSNKIAEILLKILVYQHVVPQKPQDITDKDKFVCHLVVNNVFKTRSTSAQAVLLFLKYRISELLVCV